MTVCELMHELRKMPEDAEIIMYSQSENWQYLIADGEPFSLEHDDDGTPLLYIITE